VLKKVSLALVLMSVAGVASAGGAGNGNGCINFFIFEWCPAPITPTAPPVRAPEIDPASAMAGLSLLAGGLAVLRGRRSKSSAK
jgi:hypothetical protein